MAIDTDHIDQVREALRAAGSVDPTSIQISAEDGVLVLRGSVATFEQASAAEQIAQERTDAVRNELQVDHNLREGDRLAGSPVLGDNPSSGDGLRGSSFDPLEQADDLVTDLQESLDENVPWDPPHEPVEVPTAAEARGGAHRNGDR